MFGLFKKSENRVAKSMIGDLDLLTKKEHYIRYQQKEWLVPDLTAGEYAEFCSLLEALNSSTKNKEVNGVNGLYDRIFEITVPKLPKRIKRKMSLIDSHAMFTAVLKYYGFDIANEKKKERLSKKQSS